MFDLFGIKKRKAKREAEEARKREEMLQARENRKEPRKKIVKAFLDADQNDRWERGKEAYLKDRELVDTQNNTCPVCGSKNRIHKFVRIQGELNGSINGRHTSYPGFLGSGGGYGSLGGNIKGSLDTHEVNECRDCGNQWAIKKCQHASAYDYVSNHFALDYRGDVGYMYRRVETALTEDEWPDDWFANLGRYDAFRKAPREVIEYLFYLHFYQEERCYLSSDKDDYQIFRTNVCTNKNKAEYNDDEYLFEFNKEDWDLICRVLKRPPYTGLKYEQIRTM